ncbi:MAG: right-handed parallel beta-helix repeat-containing protein [Bacteroidetes bacterium]|nr:right-handed parallel beta-helix repeat-containing protein [Bacteroidota bacterium]
MMQSAPAQDSLDVPGMAMVIVDADLAMYYIEICTDTLNLSAQAEIEFDWLKGTGVQFLERMKQYESELLAGYFIVRFDSLVVVDTITSRLLTHPQIERASKVHRVSDQFYGYTYANASHYIDDPAFGTNLAWFAHTPEPYVDKDMSLVEAWEFTFSDSTVSTIVLAGMWGVHEDYLDSTFWHEFGDQIIDGWDRHSHLDYFAPYVSGFGGQDHAHTAMRIIAAAHDTTTGGTLGFAPYSRLIPYDCLNTADFEDAVAMGHKYGASVFLISRGLYNTAEWHSALGNALDHGILPIIAAGNYSPIDGGYEITDNTTAWRWNTLNVAGNVGTHKGSKSKFGPYHKVHLSSAGGVGATSDAAATAAGVAALVKSIYPDLTAEELRQKLLASCDPMHDELWHPDTAMTQLGTGRLNAYRAIAQHKSGVITQDEVWSGPLYIPEDVIIKPGVTVTIDLTPVGNCDNRTHVRFGSLSRTQPPALIWPNIIVEGTLIVQGEENNRILFSRLQRNIQTSDGWIGQWGGIEVRYGGKLEMNHALLEFTRKGIVVFSDDVLIENTQIENTWSHAGITFQIYTPTPGLTPTVRNCEISSKANKRVGIAVWRGTPLIENCTLHSLDVGIHYYSWFARGECRENNIFDTRRHGILCVEDPRPLVIGNTIYRNEGNGISLFVNRQFPLIVDNIIEDNGRAGLRESPFQRTGDGISLSRATARLKGNQIVDNNCGVRLEAFSTVNGGDGITGLGGTEAANYFENNDISIRANDHSMSKLGFRSDWQQYGHNNISTVDPASGLHVYSNNMSVLWVQCNTWDPDDAIYFDDNSGGGEIYRFPDYSDCTPPTYQYPDSEFQAAVAELDAGHADQALLIYDLLARTADEAVISRALSGIIGVFLADSLLQYASTVDSLLTDYALLHQNASMDLRGNITYSQGIVSTVRGNNLLADSLLRFADGAMPDQTQARNNMTQLLYLHLYRNGDQTEGQNLLNDIENRFIGDSLIATARDMYRYYVDIENGSYIVKQTQNDPPADGIASVPSRAFALHANYPNPFNRMTTIRYTIHEETDVHLILTDILGRRIRDLRRSYHLPGMYEFQLDMRDLRPGLYFCTMRAATHVQSINLVLVR